MADIFNSCSYLFPMGTFPVLLYIHGNNLNVKNLGAKFNLLGPGVHRENSEPLIQVCLCTNV